MKMAAYTPENTVVVMSGGIDSTVALYRAIANGENVRGITFDYGQRHRVEIDRAEAIAQHAGIPWRCVDLSGIAGLLTSSALTNTAIDVPLDEYDGPTMDKTVVPMRNATMISVAAGYCASLGGGSVVVGIHSADHALYPDCRPEFVASMQETIDRSLDGVQIGLVAPFVNVDKAKIVGMGDKLGVPFGLTWSCYEGGDVHCGVCGTCRERRRAFAENEYVDDPTTYGAVV